MDGWMDLLSGTGVSTALRNVQWPKPFHTPAQQLQLHRGTWVGQDLSTQWCLRKLACCCSAEVLEDCRGTSCYQAESAGCFDQGQGPPRRWGCQSNWEGAQGNWLEPQVKQEPRSSSKLSKRQNFTLRVWRLWSWERIPSGKETRRLLLMSNTCANNIKTMKGMGEAQQYLKAL